ncbi:MAG: agmatine deiminase family protein [Campylobacter sp.]|nr:agmatine deiminase family protein [Campylobacter sp.]
MKAFAEWEKQRSLLVALPHENTDWKPYLNEILNSYKDFIRTASRFQKVSVIAYDRDFASKFLSEIKNIEIYQIPTNDTWIRDYGFIDAKDEKQKISYDFRFNAWGGKFQSSLDNAVNDELFRLKNITNFKKIDMILEGGSVDFNGDGVMLTTTKCLLNDNRNSDLSRAEIEANLSELFGLKQIIWLENGFIKGDDTDSHIDTLARFITPDTIAFSGCDDESDLHYAELKNMESELKQTGFNFLKLPISRPVMFEGKRLPATYANFVFVNGGLIVPLYGDKKADEYALNSLKKALPNLEVVGVDARVFIRQNGSLHCSCQNEFE